MFLRDDLPGRTAIHNENFCSVAIVSFNRHHRLRPLIESIHEHADMPFELVVSDDGGSLYDDFNFIRDLRDQVSHFAVNLGKNKGLHVNANTSVSLTRSKYVVLLADDAKIVAPFMRKAVNVLEHAPYVGTMYLGEAYQGVCSTGGVIECKTPEGQHYGLHCGVGSSWAAAFRKSYWYEVGGYSEDSMYGDIPFANKGWLKGYFSCLLEGEISAVDTDKDEQQLTQDSTGKFTEGLYCNYPKIFGIDEQTLRSWSVARHIECGRRTEDGRNIPLSEFSWVDWQHDYMRSVTEGAGHPINWEILSKHHSRFREEIDRDAIVS